MDFNEMVNNVFYGDCYVLLKEIPDKSIDLIVTDPPYEFISKNPVGGGFMKNENMKHILSIQNSFGLSFNPILFLEEIKRVCKTFNAYIFTNKTLLKDYIQFAEMNGYKWELLIWSKPNPLPLNNEHYLIDKEYIVFIKEEKSIFNSDLGYKRYFSIKSYPIGTKETTHPTEKPLTIIKDLIEISSKENDIILDPFLGSGTTIISCIRTKRRYIGFENDKEFYDIAIKRIKEECSQNKLSRFF